MKRSARQRSGKDEKPRHFGVIAGVVRRMLHNFTGRDRIDAAAGLVVIFLSAALLSCAPLVLSVVLNEAGKPVEDKRLLVFMMTGFLAMRMLGQALADARWIVVNPLLYRVVYRFCIDLCKDIIDRDQGVAVRTNKIAEVSEKVVVVQKAQAGLMSLLYHVFLIVIPTLFEALVVFVLSAWILGWRAPVAMGVGLATLAVPVWALRREEAATLQSALDADNALFREIGQVIGYSQLIRDFSCFGFFRRRLNSRIEASMRRHGAYFWIKTRRSLGRTAAIAAAQGFVLLLAYAMIASSSASDAGSIFLLITWLDRLLVPLGAMSAAAVGIQNALVSIRSVGEAFAATAPRGLHGVRVRADAQAIEIGDDQDSLRLTVRRGQKVLVRGISGSGKTTLLQELCDSLRRTAWGGSALYLPERPGLVEGAVIDNLVLDDARLSEARAGALWTATARELGRPSLSLHQSADTLSAGESQMLAVVRALLREPALLIVDEGCNAMDKAMEKAVFSLLFRRLPDVTAFIVSHRDVVPVNPDVIVTIEGGKIVSVTKPDAVAEAGPQVTCGVFPPPPPHGA